MEQAEQTHEHIRSPEQHWRIFDATLSSLIDFVYTFDREGRFLYANKALLDLWGLTLEEALGKNFFDLQYPPELAERLQRQIQQVFATGERLSDETPYTSLSGTVGYYEYVFCPVLGVNGTVELVAGATRDISTRKAAEKRLVRMEARYRGLLEAAPDAMVVVNQAGAIVLGNAQAEKQFGYGREELLGKKIEDIIPDGLPEPTKTESPSQRVGTRIELTGRRKGGGEFPVELMWSSQDSSEEVLVTAAIRDISDRRIAEEALLQRTAALRVEVTERRRAEEEMRVAKDAADVANQAKSEFLANMSHEIRTPLNAIIGMTDLTLDTELTSEQRDGLGTIKLSANFLLGIISDILDYSKIEAGKIELESINFNLRDCVGDALKALAPYAGQKGLELTCDLAPDVPELVSGDQGRLRQIILNLVGNAIKFTHHGEVALKVSSQRDEYDVKVLQFSVTDTGIGISAENQRLVFHPFTQADSSTTRKYGGTGLGLTISARLVAMMGGRIWLESEIGKGTKFHFTLQFRVLDSRTQSGMIGSVEPLMALGREQTSSPRLPVVQALPRKSLLILLAEDSRINQFVATRMLEKLGHSAIVAANGKEALLLIEAILFDLVLMDIQMPEMDGLTATMKIRANELSTQVHLPIIAMTAHAMSGDRERCIEAGMDGYISKPIDRRHLEDAIAQATCG
jgi:PAS domain S-box-containing protein